MKFFAGMTFMAILCIFYTNSAMAQGVTIGSNNPPDPSAALDIQSSQKGLLLPRLTTTQRNAIVNPAVGLQIYNSTTNCVETYFPLGGWRPTACDCMNPPVASFSFLPANPGISQAVSFAALPAGATYNWTFPSGNPATSALQNPSVQWSAPGTYTIVLIVTDNTGCSDTTSQQITISSCPGQTFTNVVTFSFTGAQQTFTVPACVTQLQVQLSGAQGGSHNTNCQGGLGGSASGLLTVSPGQVLNIFVGGQGGSNGPAGYNGGGIGDLNGYSEAAGGGGASDIRLGGTTLNDRVVVAGGGGGGGRCDCGTHTGGAGGGSTGGTGLGTNPGFGGTQSVGGAAGADACNSSSSTPGLLGIGGNGGSGGCGAGGGGGGGGGYYGGGGGGTGGNCNNASGGGGGSSYTGGVSNPATSSGVRLGNGVITITY